MKKNNKTIVVVFGALFTLLVAQSSFAVRLDCGMAPKSGTAVIHEVMDGKPTGFCIW